MIKTRIQALEDLYARVLDSAVSAEVQAEKMRTLDPKEIVYPQRDTVVAGIKMKQDWTAGMLLAQDELKLKDDIYYLGVIADKIGEENKRKISSTGNMAGPAS